MTTKPKFTPEQFSYDELDEIATDLYEALEHLQSAQNGPPLIRFEADWQEAMAKTKAALAKARGEA